MTFGWWVCACFSICVKNEDRQGIMGYDSSDESRSRVDVILLNALVVMCVSVLGKSPFSFSTAHPARDTSTHTVTQTQAVVLRNLSPCWTFDRCWHQEIKKHCMTARWEIDRFLYLLYCIFNISKQIQKDNFIIPVKMSLLTGKCIQLFMHAAALLGVCARIHSRTVLAYWSTELLLCTTDTAERLVWLLYEVSVPYSLCTVYLFVGSWLGIVRCHWLLELLVFVVMQWYVLPVWASCWQNRERKREL